MRALLIGLLNFTAYRKTLARFKGQATTDQPGAIVHDPKAHAIGFLLGDSLAVIADTELDQAGFFDDTNFNLNLSSMRMSEGIRYCFLSDSE
jgi:hypothetical protein